LSAGSRQLRDQRSAQQLLRVVRRNRRSGGEVMTMSRVDKRLIFAAAALLMIFSAMTSSAAVTPAEGACDVAADVALEVGDYATAVRLHQRLLLSDGNNALAHYHLGFAYGMAGLAAEEIGESRTAIALGLKK